VKKVAAQKNRQKKGLQLFVTANLTSRRRSKRERQTQEKERNSGFEHAGKGPSGGKTKAVNAGFDYSDVGQMRRKKLAKWTPSRKKE